MTFIIIKNDALWPKLNRRTSFTSNLLSPNYVSEVSFKIVIYRICFLGFPCLVENRMKHNVLNVNNIRTTPPPCRVITRAIFRGEKRADIAPVAHTEGGDHAQSLTHLFSKLVIVNREGPRSLPFPSTSAGVSPYLPLCVRGLFNIFLPKDFEGVQLGLCM